jgi:hypothetical protein
MIHLGYEVRDESSRIAGGAAVSIPLNHMAVLGQTQQSGKSTTLEALAARGNLTAISFLTKPGEQSFRHITPIPAFFTEGATDEYWKYAQDVLEYRLEKRLERRESGLLLQLCQDYSRETSRPVMGTAGKSKREAVKYRWKGARTLRGLLANIEDYTPLTRPRSIEEGLCIQLREYLRPTVAELERLNLSSKLALVPGINVMDLTGFSDGLKMLVIRSVVEHIHHHRRKTVVIVPEAWKFIPEGRTTPAKSAVRKLIREGAAVGNFVWFDSQDLRGVDKELLRSVIVWLYGVQQERHEVEHTLKSLPDHPRPTATQLRRLGKGQFYLSYSSIFIRVYVRPYGMEAEHAKAVAIGEESPDTWRTISRHLATTASAAAAQPEPESTQTGDAGNTNAVESIAVPDPPAGASPVVDTEDDAMWKERCEKLERLISLKMPLLDLSMLDLEIALPELQKDHDVFSSTAQCKPTDVLNNRPPIRAPLAVPQFAVPANGDYEGIWRYILARAAQERPTELLRVLIERPELEIAVKRQALQADGKSSRGRLGLLIHEGFFAVTRPAGDIMAEFRRRGWMAATGRPIAVTGPQGIGWLLDAGFLTKEIDGYVAVPGVKIQVTEETEND